MTIGSMLSGDVCRSAPWSTTEERGEIVDKDIVIIATTLASAAVLLLLSFGMSLVFGAARIINVAQATFFLYAAYFMAQFGANATPIRFVAVFVMIAAVLFVMASLLERFLVRRVYGQNHLFQLLLTLGVMYIMDDIALTIWGGSDYTGQVPSFLTGSLQIGRSSLSYYIIFIIAVAIAIIGVLAYMLKYTKIGWKLTAIVDHRENLELLGYESRRIATVIFGVSAVLAAIGGVLIVPLQAAGPGVDSTMLIQSFIVVVIGGIGSFVGVGIGALAIATLETLLSIVAPNLVGLAPYLAMVGVLVLRPNGIMNVVPDAREF